MQVDIIEDSGIIPQPLRIFNTLRIELSLLRLIGPTGNILCNIPSSLVVLKDTFG